MSEHRAEKLINLITATMVLLAGFYVILFLPVPFSMAGRVLIGIILVLYFIWRLNQIRGRFGKESRLGDKDSPKE